MRVIGLWMVLVSCIGLIAFACSKEDETEDLACGGPPSGEGGPPPKSLVQKQAQSKPAAGDCTGGGSSTTTGDSGSSGSTGSSCDLSLNTATTGIENSYGCEQLDRDTTSCQSDREAQGLSGFWLKFSCRVTLTKSGSSVTLTSENLPDYKSYYFSSSDACYDSFSSDTRAANPNYIASQTITMTVPYSPTAASSATSTPEGVIGMTLNGIAIYDNSAAPGDDIYDEEATFDRCDGHPDMFSRYHYHTEPGSVSNADYGFVGILRDGFPVYGRYDYDSNAAIATSSLDSQGGRTATTVDSPATAVYHYVINLQSNGTDSAYFISAGAYTGTPGTCTGCQ